jgi:hypothetical protein
VEHEGGFPFEAYTDPMIPFISCSKEIDCEFCRRRGVLVHSEEEIKERNMRMTVDEEGREAANKGIESLFQLCYTCVV